MTHDVVEVADRIRADVVGDRTPQPPQPVERDRQHPGPPAYPGRLVEPERLPVGSPRPYIEQAPAWAQLDRRIAPAETTKVDHAGQPASFGQQIAGQEIAVQPYRRSGPLVSRHRLVPRRGHRPTVDPIAQYLDRATGQLVAPGQRNAALNPLLDRPTHRVDRHQRAHETGEIDGEMYQVLPG